MDRLKTILGPDGHPAEGAAVAVQNGNGHPNGNGSYDSKLKMFANSWNSYLQSLAQVEWPTATRARDPFSNHPWIFAAAMTVAIVASQAPLTIFRETKRALEERRRKASEFGRPWAGPRAGKDRRAVQRHLQGNVLNRFFWSQKGIEPDLEHPLYEVLLRPNPYQDGGQLQQFTDLVYALKGEAEWLTLGPNGERRRTPLDPVGQIWPYTPDYFEPILSNGTYGNLIGWWFTPPFWSPDALNGRRRIRLDVHEVIQFKYPNPTNLLRGMSRIAAAAMGVDMDLTIMTQHRNLLKKQAIPRGVMKYTANAAIDPKELQDRATSFKEHHAGEENAGETLFLPAGWEYQSLGLTPHDLQNLELMKWDRDFELAAIGVPMSVLGVTEFKTYATQLGQDKNLLDKNVVPMKRSQERTLDATLFYPETDDVFGAYDFKDMEAMRAGLEHKVTIAKSMAGQELHAPPTVAYQTVGLEVERYPGDDKCFVSPLVTTAEDAAAGLNQVEPAMPGEEVEDEDDPENPVDPDQEKPTTPADGEEPDTGKKPAGEKVLDLLAARLERRFFGSEKHIAPGLRAREASVSHRAEAPGVIIRVSRGERIYRARRKWKDFVRVEFAIEKLMRVAYKSWVGEMRRDILARFDEATGKKASNIDLTAILPDPGESRNKLTAKSQPIHYSALEATFALTSEEVGVPTFDIQDDRIMTFFDAREKKFTGSVTGTLIKNVRRSLEQGVQADETIQQLRLRVGRSLEIAAGSFKTLNVVRTEVGGFMNGVRNEMFGAQGFEKEDWVTAGDENVRDSHIEFGEAGPQQRGFNYLSLVGKGGTLRYPGDMDAPVEEVTQCRCLKVPVAD